MNAPSPYPGLRPFARNESHLFFGRKPQIEEVLNLMEGHRLVAVVGESGTGKSSLVDAGVLPALEGDKLPAAGDEWAFVRMQPTASPIEAAARALIECPETRKALRVDDLDRAQAIRQVVARLASNPVALSDILQRAQAESGKAVLLRVDQFEEIFRYEPRPNASAPKDFVERMLRAAEVSDRARSAGEAPLEGASDKVYVLLTMRSDYLGECARFPDLAEAVNQGSYLTPRLPRERQREAIEGPLIGAPDAEIDVRLVTALLNETAKDASEADDPAPEGKDKLPLMQHALMRLWQTAERANGRRWLGLEAYEALAEPIGRKGKGVPSAPAARPSPLQQILDNHLELTLAAPEIVWEKDFPIVERMFKSLTNRDKSKQDSRKEVTAAEVAAMQGVSEDAVVRLASLFAADGRNFLWIDVADESTSGTDDVAAKALTTLDLVHESLIRRWSRLREWADEERSEILDYEHVLRDAKSWKKGEGGLMESLLLRKYRLWLGGDERARRRAWVEFRTRGKGSESRPWSDEFDLVVAYIEASERRHRTKRIATWLTPTLVAAATTTLGVAGLALLTKNRGLETDNRSLLTKSQNLEANNRSLMGLYQRLSATSKDLEDRVGLLKVSDTFLTARKDILGNEISARQDTVKNLRSIVADQGQKLLQAKQSADRAAAASEKRRIEDEKRRKGIETLLKRAEIDRARAVGARKSALASLAAAKGSLTALKAKIEGQNAVIAEKQKEIDGKDAVIAEKQKEIDGKDADIKAKQDEVRVLQGKFDGLDVEIKALSTEIDSKTDELAALKLDASQASQDAKAEIKRLTEGIDAAKKIIDALSSSNETVKNQLKALSTSLGNAQRQFGSTTSPRGKFKLALRSDASGFSLNYHYNQKNVVWSTDDKDPATRLPFSGDLAVRAAFSPKDDWLVVVGTLRGGDPKLNVYKLHDDDKPEDFKPVSLPSVPKQIQVSVKEHRIAALFEDGTIQVWEVEPKPTKGVGKTDGSLRFSLMTFADDKGERMYLETPEGVSYSWEVSSSKFVRLGAAPG